MDSRLKNHINVHLIKGEVDFAKAPWRTDPPSDQSTYFVFKDSRQIFAAICHEFIRESSQSIQLRGKFHAVLTGRSTPMQFYDLISTESNSSQIDWNNVYLYLSDDRFVPHTNKLSNAAMIDRHLISKIPIPADNVVRINCEHSNISAAAKEYSDSVAKNLGNNPRFDFVLAGLGSDGHTASLFPNIPQLAAEGIALAIAAPTHIEPQVARISLSLKVLQDARRTFFIATGSSKYPMLKSIITDPGFAKKQYPAAMVDNGNEVNWMVDELAAGTEKSSLA